MLWREALTWPPLPLPCPLGCSPGLHQCPDASATILKQESHFLNTSVVDPEDSLNPDPDKDPAFQVNLDSGFDDQKLKKKHS
jgi:hypothetical protein